MLDASSRYECFGRKKAQQTCEGWKKECEYYSKCMEWEGEEPGKEVVVLYDGPNWLKCFGHFDCESGGWENGRWKNCGLFKECTDTVHYEAKLNGVVVILKENCRWSFYHPEDFEDE